MKVLNLTVTNFITAQKEFLEQSINMKSTTQEPHPTFAQHETLIAHLFGVEGRLERGHVHLLVALALFAVRALGQLTSLVGHQMRALREGQVFKVKHRGRVKRL